MEELIIPNMGFRHEVRYSKVWAKVEDSKLLFSSEYSEKYSDELLKNSEKKAREYWDNLLFGIKIYQISEVVKAPKDTYTELYLYKVFGNMKQDEFHSTAYYTLKRVFILYSDLKERLKK